MATGIEACIPEWTREISTFSNGELLKTAEQRRLTCLYLIEGSYLMENYLARLKILRAEISKRGLKRA